MKPVLCLVMFMLVPVRGAESQTRQVPVDIAHEKGSFSGQLSVSVNGSLNKAKVEWDGTISNTSPHRIFRVTFCVKAYDAAGQQIKPGGGECTLVLWGTDWQPGAPLGFKGKQSIKIGEGKMPVQVATYAVVATEVLDQALNLRAIDRRCPVVWASALRVFADRKFRPTVMDKDSFTATYAFDGGRVDGYDATRMLKAFTTADTALLGSRWESFRIDAASLYLREETPGTCGAEVKMSFAGFGKPLLGTFGWFAVESNFNFEKALLDSVEVQSRQAGLVDPGTPGGSIAPPPPGQAETAIPPQLTITSEPDGAEVEIDGEFIGNAPTTVSTKEGVVVVRVKKSGYQPWERSLKLSVGDRRTLLAEMVK